MHASTWLILVLFIYFSLIGLLRIISRVHVLVCFVLVRFTFALAGVSELCVWMCYAQWWKNQTHQNHKQDNAVFFTVEFNYQNSFKEDKFHASWMLCQMLLYNKVVIKAFTVYSVINKFWTQGFCICGFIFRTYKCAFVIYLTTVKCVLIWLVCIVYL